MSESEQQVATALLLRFYMNSSGATYAEIAEAADVPTVLLKTRKKDGVIEEREDRGKNVANFHNSFTSEHADKIRTFLEQKISDHTAFRNRLPIIDGLIVAMRGSPIRPAGGIGGLLSAYIEDGDTWKQRVFDVYGGAWYIVRFAAHLGPDASEQASKRREDPSMVYAIIDIRPKIEKYGNDLPGFLVRYRPLREIEPRNIFGNVLSLKTGPYMILMGLEEGTTHPVVIAADQNRDGSARPKIFKSLILRKAEHGSFISGYTMFIRAERPWSDIVSHKTLGKVGVLPKSQLIKLLKPEEPTIDEMIPTLRNVSKNRGNAMLCL
jgi:hypothetical protein